MLHEILMALAGYPGDVFIRYEEEGPLREEWAPSGGEGPPPLFSSTGCFRVNPSLSSFNPSEKEALERAVAPGYDLLLVKEFIAAAETAGGPFLGVPSGAPPGESAFRGPLRPSTGSLSSAATAAAAAVPGGLYTAALARAARDIQETYLSFLVIAEEEALQQPATPLSAIPIALGDQPHRMRILRHILSQVNPKP